MAAELGELIMAVDADNTRLKKSLKDSEKITKKAGQAMSQSLDKVKGSSIEAGQGFSLLEKAAAATGMVWIGHIKSIAELVYEFVGLKASLAASTLGWGLESAAVGKNTLALAANKAAREASPLGLPWEGKPGVRRPPRVTIGEVGGTGAAGYGVARGVGALTGKLKALAVAAKTAVTAIGAIPIAGATVLAFGAAMATNFLGVRDAVDRAARSLADWWYGLGKANKALERTNKLLQLKQAAQMRTMEGARRETEIARLGLTGSAAHEVRWRGRKKGELLDEELKAMRYAEERAKLAVNVAEEERRIAQRKADAAREAERELAAQKGKTDELRRQADLARIQARQAKEMRLAAGVAGPAEVAGRFEYIIYGIKKAASAQLQMLRYARDLLIRDPRRAGDVALLLRSMGTGQDAARTTTTAGYAVRELGAVDRQGLPAPMGGINTQAAAGQVQKRQLSAQERLLVKVDQLIQAVLGAFQLGGS